MLIGEDEVEGNILKNHNEMSLMCLTFTVQSDGCPHLTSEGCSHIVKVCLIVWKSVTAPFATSPRVVWHILTRR